MKTFEGMSLVILIVMNGSGFEFVFEFFISDLGRSRILISIWV
jgi:hypothetical protein